MLPTTQMLTLVPTEWQDEFLTFIDSGEASDEFLDVLDNSTDMQQAVEHAVTSQSDALQALAQRLKAADMEPVPQEVVPETQNVGTMSWLKYRLQEMSGVADALAQQSSDATTVAEAIHTAEKAVDKILSPAH